VIKAAESNGGIASGNYYFRFKSHSEIASELRSSLSVSPYREGSSIIFISATGVQPQKLIRFLNTFSEELIENNLERKNDMANRSLTFIQRQLEQVAETLKITQQKLMDFRRDNRYMIPSDVSSKLSDEFFGMEKQKRSLELSLAYFDEIRRRLVSGNLEESDFLLPAFSTEPAALIQQFVREHLTLLNEARVIAQQAGENNPYLVELNQKIELSGQSLILSIDQQMESIRMQMRELKQTEAQLNAEIGNLPELERDYLAMERTHKLNDAIYTFLLQKSSETQIAKASNTPDNEVLDPAYINGVVSPSKKSNYTRGLLLGFAIPVLIIGLRELFNTRIRSRDDVRSMFRELPIIGEILRSKEGSDNVVLKAATSEVTESFRSLRARLKYMMAGKDGCIITVSSTNTGDGKTFCAVNLASVLAISGKKTVLVGFDLRKPRLSEIFGLKNISGLSSYLIAQSELDEITFETDVKNLYIIPGGHIPPNPSELISSPSTQTLFETLRTKYDVIIVDTPPVGLVSDGRLLMEMADCNLYIVRAGVTDKEHFAVTMSNLFDDKIKGLAVVMNDVQIAGRNYGYYSSGY
jgi:capsular exopolysaccharide synthesis family protein